MREYPLMGQPGIRSVGEKERGLYFVSYGATGANLDKLNEKGVGQMIETGVQLAPELAGFERVFFASDSSDLAVESVRVFEIGVHRVISEKTTPLKYFYQPDVLQDELYGRRDNDLLYKGVPVGIFRKYEEMLEAMVAKIKKPIDSAALVHIGRFKLQDLLLRSGTGYEHVRGGGVLETNGQFASFRTTDAPDTWKIKSQDWEGTAVLAPRAQRFEAVLAP